MSAATSIADQFGGANYHHVVDVTNDFDRNAGILKQRYG